MARSQSPVAIAARRQGKMHEAIQSAATGATIMVANEKDADFWRGIAQFDYSRGDLKFSWPGKPASAGGLLREATSAADLAAAKAAEESTRWEREGKRREREIEEAAMRANPLWGSF